MYYIYILVCPVVFGVPAIIAQCPCAIMMLTDARESETVSTNHHDLVRL